MKEPLWRSLVTAIRSGQCVLVLGPEVPAAREGAPEVSVREAFCDYLLGELGHELPPEAERILFAIAQQFEDSPEYSSSTLRNNAADYFRDPPFRPGALHHALARFPFPLVLTTCHDQLFAAALAQAGKTPAPAWYDFRGEPRDNREIDTSLRPDAPVVYHLFGWPQLPSSLVLTENDLLDFSIRLISGKPGLPDSLRSVIRNKTFLFVGFGIGHWYIRVMLKLLLRVLDVSAGSVALEQLSRLDTREREQTALFYRRGTRVEVVDMESQPFLDDLWARYQKAGGAPAVAPRVRKAQVFISYERSDEPTAQRLYDALPRDTIEPLLDRAYLQGGDDWNERLEQALAGSDYFVVLNSPHLKAKAVGYVNKEIKLALDRRSYYGPGLKFVFPLGVDGFDAAAGREDLRAFHQLPLRNGEPFAADVGQIASAIFRDFQLRTARP